MVSETRCSAQSRVAGHSVKVVVSCNLSPPFAALLASRRWHAGRPARLGRLAEPQRQQMTESFRRYIPAIYADRFESYAGQTPAMIGEKAVPAGVAFYVSIGRTNGGSVKVDYLR